LLEHVETVQDAKVVEMALKFVALDGVVSDSFTEVPEGEISKMLLAYGHDFVGV